jgi:hypothetical protein
MRTHVILTSAAQRLALPVADAVPANRPDKGTDGSPRGCSSRVGLCWAVFMRTALLVLEVPEPQDAIELSHQLDLSVLAIDQLSHSLAWSFDRLAMPQNWPVRHSSCSVDNWMKAHDNLGSGHREQQIQMDNQKIQRTLLSDKLNLARRPIIEEKLLWSPCPQAVYKLACCWKYLRH